MSPSVGTLYNPILLKTYNIYSSHNFFNQCLRYSIQILLFEQGIAFFPVLFFTTGCPLGSFFMTVSIHTIAIFFTKRSGCPSVQVSPEPSAFPVIKTILTIVNIKIRKPFHKLLLLQKSALGNFYYKYSRIKVVNYLKRFQNDGISLINFSRSNRFSNTVFNTGGRSPDKSKYFTGYFLYFHCSMSQFISAPFKSNDTTVQPIFLATLPTLPVPLNNSNNFIILL